LRLYFGMPKLVRGRYFQLYSPRDKSSEAYDCQSAAVTFCVVWFGRVRVKANSHRHARHDKSVSRPLRRCELDSRQLKTVADRKSEVWTRIQQSSNSYRHTRHDKTVSPACRPPPRRRPGRQAATPSRPIDRPRAATLYAAQM